jgi:hypothetical protein
MWAKKYLRCTKQIFTTGYSNIFDQRLWGYEISQPYYIFFYVSCDFVKFNLIPINKVSTECSFKLNSIDNNRNKNKDFKKVRSTYIYCELLPINWLVMKYRFNNWGF